MIRDDVLLRQVRAFAEAVLRALTGRRDEDRAEVEARCEGAVGLPLHTARRLPLPTLVGLLTTTDGLDARRAVLLGLALLSTGDPKGRALVEAGLAARPELATEEVRRVLGE